MQEIRESAICLCVGCLICSIISIIAPKGGTEKLIKLAVGAFLLLSVINSVSDIKPDLNLISLSSDSAVTENVEAVNDFAQDIIKKQLSGHIESVLEQMNIPYEKIEIQMDISDDASISIGQTTVAVDRTAFLRREQIENEIFIRTGMKVTLCTQEK